MPTPFSSQDLGRIFDARALTRGRSLGLAGGVDVQLERRDHHRRRPGPAVTHTVAHHPVPARPPGGVRPPLHLPRPRLRASGRGGLRGARPVSRPPAPGTADLPRHADHPPAEKERQRIVFELAPGDPPHACIVTSLLIGERSGIATPTTPRADRRGRQSRAASAATSPTCWAKAPNRAPACRASAVRRRAGCAGGERPGALARRRPAPGQGRDQTVRLRLGRHAAAALGRDRRR